MNKYLIFFPAIVLWGIFISSSQDPFAFTVEGHIRKISAQLSAKLYSQRSFVHDKVLIDGQPVSGYRADFNLPSSPRVCPVDQALSALTAREASNIFFYPQHYREGFVVQAQGMKVTVKALAGGGEEAQIENGKLVYHQVYPSTDSLQVVDKGRSEEFLLLHDDQAPKRFTYEITENQGVAKIELKDGNIQFKGEKGQSLEIESPWLVDGAGHMQAGAVRWDLKQENGRQLLSLVLTNPSKLAYPVVIDPSWITVGNLNAGRGFHTATLLQNGKVLIAGGWDGLHALNTAELYDPGKGTWTATGNLQVARLNHTATLLPNGQVLVAGGNGDSPYLLTIASAELYDPNAGTWSMTGSLNAARQEDAAVLLPNGKVMVAGGVDPTNNSVSSTELYDPGTKVWTTVGNLGTPRFFYTTTLLPNGKVLAAAGADDINGRENLLNTAELFDPSSNTWTPTGNLNVSRARHMATCLQNGKVLVTGGDSRASGQSVELYDPTLGTWTIAGNLNVPRAWHSATLLPNGKVLVAGGRDFSINAIEASVELYDPTSNTWSSLSNLQTARQVHTATLLPSGEVLVAGGEDDVNTAEIYNPNVGTWATTNSMNLVRTWHTSTLLPSGKVLIAGGIGAGELGRDEIYDSNSGTWSYTGDSWILPSFHTATLLPSGKVLVAGGSYFVSGANTLDYARIYNPVDETWSFTSYLNYARQSHTATLLPNGKVLIAGGYQEVSVTNNSYNSVGTNTAELYDSASEVWTLTGNLNTLRAYHTATLLQNGKVLVAGGYNYSTSTALNSSELYDPATGTWTPAGNLNVARQSHTATLLPNGKVLISGGSNNSGVISSAELYDPSTSLWTTTGSLNTGRVNHASTLLPNGQVLVTGGYNNQSLLSAELYRPDKGTWTTINSLHAARYGHTASLLPNGKVLVAGGFNINSQASAEIYDPNIGYQSSWQPVINTVSSVHANSTTLTLTGTGFTGTTEASSGTCNSSPTNYPLVQLHSLVNDQIMFVPLDPVQGFSNTSFASSTLSSVVGSANYFTPGHALATVFVNGIPSLSQTIRFGPKLDQTISFGIIHSQTADASFTPSATASSDLPVSFSIVSGPATLSGNQIIVTGPGLVVVQAHQAGNGDYNDAPSVQQSFVVASTFAQWSSVYFNGADSSVSGVTAIPQHDGTSNLLKYVYDINPTIPMSSSDRTALPQTSIINTTTYDPSNPIDPYTNHSYITLTYRQNSAANGITVSLQKSSDLQTWQTVTPDLSQTIGTDPVTSDPIVQVGVDVAGTSQLFIRLSVTSP